MLVAERDARQGLDLNGQHRVKLGLGNADLRLGDLMSVIVSGATLATAVCSGVRRNCSGPSCRAGGHRDGSLTAVLDVGDDAVHFLGEGEVGAVAPLDVASLRISAMVLPGFGNG